MQSGELQLRACALTKQGDANSVSLRFGECQEVYSSLNTFISSSQLASHTIFRWPSNQVLEKIHKHAALFKFLTRLHERAAGEADPTCIPVVETADLKVSGMRGRVRVIQASMPACRFTSTCMTQTTRQSLKPCSTINGKYENHDTSQINKIALQNQYIKSCVRHCMASTKNIRLLFGSFS